MAPKIMVKVKTKFQGCNFSQVICSDNLAVLLRYSKKKKIYFRKRFRVQLSQLLGMKTNKQKNLSVVKISLYMLNSPHFNKIFGFMYAL